MPLYSSTLGMVVVVPGTRWTGPLYTKSVPRPGKQVILHLRVGELQERYEHIWDHGVSPPVRVLGRGAQMGHADSSSRWLGQTCYWLFRGRGSQIRRSPIWHRIKMERIVQGLSDNDLQDHLVRGIADQDILADPLGDEGILLLIPYPTLPKTRAILMLDCILIQKSGRNQAHRVGAFRDRPAPGVKQVRRVHEEQTGRARGEEIKSIKLLWF